ncbi:MAG: hypothetical protein LIO86_14900 [Lachnospiraceae bacterium]|nr:hypothetical protein [Lachnospiraceae bacterium]
MEGEYSRRLAMAYAVLSVCHMYVPSICCESYKVEKTLEKYYNELSDDEGDEMSWHVIQALTRCGRHYIYSLNELDLTLHVRRLQEKLIIIIESDETPYLIAQISEKSSVSFEPSRNA